MNGPGAMERSDPTLGADAESLADILMLARAVLPEPLLDDLGWERLFARAGSLPPSAADAAFGFEFRLNEREASADLLLSIPPDAPFSDALVREGGSRGPGAASLARFLSELKQADSPLAAAVDLVALEYDVVGVEGSPAPGVFLRSAEDGYADAGVVSAAVSLAAGWSEAPSESVALARVFAALPTGASIRWAGAFPGRERAVRLLVRAPAGGDVSFLGEMGWTGDAAALEEVLSHFRAGGAHNRVFALDVTEGRVSPGLGIELSQPEQANAGLRETLDNDGAQRLVSAGEGGRARPAWRGFAGSGFSRASGSSIAFSESTTSSSLSPRRGGAAPPSARRVWPQRAISSAP